MSEETARIMHSNGRYKVMSATSRGASRIWRVIVIVAILAMLAGMLAACGEGYAEETPVPKGGGQRQSRRQRQRLPRPGQPAGVRSACISNRTASRYDATKASANGSPS